MMRFLVARERAGTRGTTYHCRALLADLLLSKYLVDMKGPNGRLAGVGREALLLDLRSMEAHSHDIGHQELLEAHVFDNLVSPPAV